MATSIIDAFVVSFSLDARQYKTGERELSTSLKRTKEQAKSTFDDFEDRAKKGGMSLRSLANEAAGFLLVLAGADSIKDFAAGLIHSEAQAGRLADRLGMLPAKVVAWQQAIKGVGGSPGDASAALEMLSGASQSLRMTGTTGNDRAFRSLGIDVDTMKRGDLTDILLKIAAAGEKLSKPQFNNLLGRIGMSPSMVTLLMQGRGELEKTLKVAEAHADVTERDVKAAQQFEKAMADLSNTIGGLVRGPLTTLIEGLNDLLTNADGATGKMLGLSQAGRKWALALAEIKAAREGRWGDLENLIRQDFTDTTGLTKNGMKPGGDANGSFKGGGSSAGMTPKQQAAWDAIKRETDRVRAALGGGGNSDMGRYIESYLQRATGIGADEARGITGGLYAESKLNPNARNPLSGAYGIGQWLGTRKTDLFRRYGRNPSLDQQLAFLAYEINGGDPGGRAVKSQSGADHALLSFVGQMLRPQGANWEHSRDYLRDIAAGRRYIAGQSGGTTNIGHITVNTRATDADGIARDLPGALKRRSVVSQANNGLQP